MIFSQRVAVNLDDLPESVDDWFGGRAEAAGLSLSKFALRKLEQSGRVGRKAKIFAQLRRLPPTGISDEQIVEDIRAERERAG